MKVQKAAVILLLGVIATAPILFGQSAERPQELESLLKGKLALLEGELEAALENFHRFQQQYVKLQSQEGVEDAKQEALYWESVFFEARVLEKLERAEEALERYEKFLNGTPDHPLSGQGLYSVVDLSVLLYEEGIQNYIDRALEALESSQEELRQAAAVRLSYLEDRKMAEKAVPVLQELISESSDPEIKNQATLALLRIDPNLLQKETSPRPDSAKSTLKLLLVEDGEELVRLSFPLSFARLLLAALPEEARRELDQEGIKPENILAKLERMGGSIEVEAEGHRLKIWIE